MLEIDSVYKRCIICKGAIALSVWRYDLDEDGEERATNTIEKVPHSIFDCKKQLQLDNEEWPPVK
jgi:hypothetical protein